MVPEEGFEPPTFTLRKCCSTPELHRHITAAGRVETDSLSSCARGRGERARGQTRCSGRRASCGARLVHDSYLANHFGFVNI